MTLIDRAAQAAGKNRSELVLDAATREATAVRLDRRFLQLDARTFKRFAAALDAAPSDNPRLCEPWRGKPLGAMNAPEVTAPEQLTAPA